MTASAWPYGRIIKRYEGIGTLEGPQGQVACTFEILQLTTGRLLARVQLERDQLVYGWVGKSTELRGETKTGERVATQGGFVKSARPIPQDRGWVTELTLRCGTATIGQLAGVTAVRYGLTNLKLEGNEGYREDLSDGRFQLGRQSRVSVEGRDVIIRSLPGSEELLEEIRETRGIGVTAEATVQASLDDAEQADELMDRLCLLLSLSLGRAVVWVYRESIDAEGHVVEARHVNAKTKPCSGIELVPTEAIEGFVAATYPTFRAAYERWGLRNAIRSYVDALLEGDYLEFRALKMVVVLEYLNRRYCDGLGQMSFRTALAGMCSSLRVPLSEEDLDLVRDARNRLIHEATFLEEEAAPSVHEQYLFLAMVVGEILLAIVGHQGEWYDWRGASDGNGPRRTQFRLPPVE
jgi:hypothetical protein